MRRLLAILLLLPALAQSEMNFITLKHRNAEQLIPLLQPVLDEGVRISGQGPTLIVNSQPWQLAEIEKLLAQLDTPLQSLMISVIQGGDNRQSTIGGDVSGTLERPRVRISSTNKQGKEAVRQQLRVIEGQWAFISAGQSVPVGKQTTTQNRHGTTTQKSIEYKDVQSGFEVRPRVSGENIILEVRPFRAKRSGSGGGVIEQQELSTTVSGKLGEWLTIGGIDEQEKRSGIGTVYTTGKNKSSTHNVKLKVERLPN